MTYLACGHKTNGGLAGGQCPMCLAKKIAIQEDCLHVYNNLDPLDDNYIICRTCDARLDNSRDAQWFKKLVASKATPLKSKSKENSFAGKLKNEHLSFDVLREANIRMTRDCFPISVNWTTEQWVLALVGEVGELCNYLKKRNRGQKVKQIDIENEFADILLYLDKLAHKEGVDLSKVTRRKYNAVARRHKSKLKL